MVETSPAKRAEVRKLRGRGLRKDRGAHEGEPVTAAVPGGQSEREGLASAPVGLERREVEMASELREIDPEECDGAGRGVRFDPPARVHLAPEIDRLPARGLALERKRRRQSSDDKREGGRAKTRDVHGPSRAMRDLGEVLRIAVRSRWTRTRRRRV